MNSSVRINVRVAMGNAIAQFQRLRAQLDSMKVAAERASVASVGFGTRASAAFSKVELAGKRLGQSARILIYNFTLPLAAAFYSVEKAALNVAEKQALLAQVYSTATGESAKFGGSTRQVTKDLSELNQVALALSNGFGLALTDVYDLMIIFGRAGASGVQLATATENGLVLMRAFGLSAQAAADAVMQVSVSYGLAGKQTLAATAVIAYAAQKTRADVETLTAGFVKAAPAASQLGIDVVHLASMLAVMQQAGFKGAEAGTALNFGLTRLVKSTPEAIKLFHQIGLSLDEAAFATANGTKRFDMVNQALSNMGSAQRQAAIAVMYGVRQQPKFTAAISDALKPAGLYNQLLHDMTDSTALLAWQDNQLLLAMDNNKTKFEILKTQLKNNFLAIAIYLTPALLALMQVLVGVSRKFAELGNTTGGRTKQAFIVLAVVALAAVGPIALVASSVEVLIGLLGDLAVVMWTRVLPAMLGPWGLVVAGLVALIFVFVKFRDQFVAVLKSMYSAVLAVAKAIYKALQWLNPFARHSPSLVERTRDGVAAMVGYWQQLSPVLAVMDVAEAKSRAFSAAMQQVTNAKKALDRANDTSLLAQFGGGAAVAAYDDLAAANDRLAAQLPLVERAYAQQAKKVDVAKAALDAATASVDDASAALDGLKGKQDSLQKMLDKLGDPAGLRSQAQAASEMGRALLEAGNTGLAKRFGDQASALNKQATQAEAVQTQMSSVADQIAVQEAAVKSLTAERDRLQATYDAELGRLQMLKDGYDAITKAIEDNNRALSDLVATAKDLQSTQNAGGGKTDSLAQFNASAGGGDLALTGADALPDFSKVGQDAQQSLDQYLADLNTRMADRMHKLFGDPFAQIKGWGKKFKEGLHSLGNLFDGINLGSLNDLKFKLEDAVGGDPFKGVRKILDESWSGTKKAFAATVDGIGQPLHVFVGGLRAYFWAVIGLGEKLFKVMSEGVMNILRDFGDWWDKNGKNIGKVIGFLVDLALRMWGVFYQVMAVLISAFGPIVVDLLKGFYKAAKSIMDIILGIAGALAALLTGDWSALWDNLKKVGSGIVDGIVSVVATLGQVLWDTLKGAFEFVIGALLAFLGIHSPSTYMRDEVGIPIIHGIVAGIEAATQFLADALLTLAKKIPGWIWDGVTGAWDISVTFVKWIADKFVEYAPKVLGAIGDFGKKIPGWIWDGLKAYWSTVWDIAGWIGAKFVEYEKAAYTAIWNFGKKIPGWIWDGLKAYWSTVFDIASFVADKFAGYATSIAGTAWNFGVGIFNGLWGGLKNAFWTSFALVGLVGDALWNGMNWLWSGLVDFGANIIRGIIAGIGSLAQTLWNTMVGVFKTLLDKARAAMSVNSPSKVYRDQIGKPIMEGIAVGIEHGAGWVSDSLLTALDDARRVASQAKFDDLLLPTLTQMVTLQYTNQPLNGLPGLTSGSGAVGGDGASVGGALSSGTQINTTINMNAAEAADPQAIAATLAWKLAGQVA